MSQIQVPAIQQSGEHSSCAADSTVKDADYHEGPIIQEIQKIVESPFMDEVVDVRVVMKGWCVRFRRAEDLDVVLDPVQQQDHWCSCDDATPGSHSSSATNDRCL